MVVKPTILYYFRKDKLLWRSKFGSRDTIHIRTWYLGTLEQINAQKRAQAHKYESEHQRDKLGVQVQIIYIYKTNYTLKWIM